MKKIISFILVLAMILSMTTLIFAVEKQEWEGSGMYDLQVESKYSGKITLTALTSGNAVAAEETTNGATLYTDAERLKVVVDSSILTEGKYYMIFVFATNGAFDGPVVPTKDTISNLVYINQETAVSEGVEFNVYPSKLTGDYEYDVYLSSNDTADNKIGAYEKVGSFKYYEPYILGDVVCREDGSDKGSVDISDAMAIINWIVGKIELTPVQKLAANADGKTTNGQPVDISDAMAIINLIVGKIDHLGL